MLGVEGGVDSVSMEVGGVIFSSLYSCLKGGGREGFKDFSLLLLPLHHAGGGRGRLVLLVPAGSVLPVFLCRLAK